MGDYLYSRISGVHTLYYVVQRKEGSCLQVFTDLK
jgi:hypothetical protein